MKTLDKHDVQTQYFYYVKHKHLQSHKVTLVVNVYYIVYSIVSRTFLSSSSQSVLAFQCVSLLLRQ